MKTSEISFESLSEGQAQERLSKLGLNEIAQSKKEKFWVRYSKFLKEPMLLLLVGSGAVYLAMGDFAEGAMLCASIFVVIGISVYQERRSQNALAALRDLSSPRALVIRDGKEKRIAANQLVPGDLVLLHEGDRVPADGVILQSSNLRIDESLLTGESFPVAKAAGGVDSSKQVFSSTLIVGGTGFFRVEKTGIHTSVGMIGKALQETQSEELNLAKEIRQIVRLFLWTGSLICISIVLLYGLKRGDWLQAFLVGLATQMSLLPEEFPVVLALFLAMGAWRLSKLQVLIRSPEAIERLGAVTVLCVDKTGTLTQNRMTVAALNNSKTTLWLDLKVTQALEERFHEIAEYGVLASQRDPFDPMEKAIRRLLEENLWGKDHLRSDWELIRNYPLSDQLLAMSCVWKRPQSDEYVIAAKGAPEAMVGLCHLDAVRASEVLKAAQEMARKGLRVLGVARAVFGAQPLPDQQHDFEFKWLGLIGLEDPLRSEVPAAIQLCKEAGIQVMMMTGDYPETAMKIAEQAGISVVNALVTGTELNALSDDELRERLQIARIFARMVPEQKLRIVKMLKSLGHVVAMTGDGVNDAPSLKWADIGIAMGGRGTDVAREASDIVLLDDNFASIVSGVERGRLIFRNIRKAMSYIVSIHVPIAGLSLLPVLFGWSPLLLPIHIVFLELIIDPACSLMFESQGAEEEAMSEPPRSLKTRLFSGRDLLRSFLQGGFVFVVIGSWVAYDLNVNRDDPERARAFSFVILAMSIVGLIFADMSGGSFRQLVKLFKKKMNLGIVLGVALCLFGISQVTGVRSLFRFGPLLISEFLTALAVALFVAMSVAVWNRLVSIRKSPFSIKQRS